MARPKGVIENKPRKKMARRGIADGEGYTLPDSGCGGATHYLGHASLCLRCPFPECRLEEPRRKG